jgi:hypothetical protein
MSFRLAFVAISAAILFVITGDAAEPAQFDQRQPEWFPFRQDGADGKWGYIDAGGKIVVEPNYRQAGDFVSGRARVSTTDKTGYIDQMGRWVFTLPNSLASTRPFSDGVAGVCVGNMYDGKWGFTDRDGKIIVSPRYDQIGDFNEGRARVNIGATWHFPRTRSGGKWGFIDKNGILVIGLDFDSAHDFSGGHAEVTKDGRAFYIDRHGLVIKNAQATGRRKKKQDLPRNVVRKIDGRMKKTNDRETFRGDLARVHLGGSFMVADDGPAEWSGGGWYYVNRKGHIVRKVRRDEEGQARGYGREER